VRRHPSRPGRPALAIRNRPGCPDLRAPPAGARQLPAGCRNYHLPARDRPVRPRAVRSCAGVWPGWKSVCESVCQRARPSPGRNGRGRGRGAGPGGSRGGVRPPGSKTLWPARGAPGPPPPHLWFWGEYLLWHVSNGSLPNGLVATSPADSIASLIADPIGLTNPAGRNAEYGMSSGLRVAVGHWGGPCMRFGAELGFLFPEHKPDQFTVASDPTGNPIVLRPFTNAATFAPDFAVVAAPGAAAGSVVVSSINRLWGREVNGAFRFIVEPDWYLTPIIGIRYLDFQEDLDISQTTALIGQGVGAFRGQQVGAPGVIVVTDHFGARTQFFGGQLGGRLGVRENRLTVEAYWKVAIGWSHMATDVAGSTALRGLGPPAVSPGGLLAVPSNSGHFTADDLAVVPEFGLQAGYDVTRWFRVTAGYSAMFWSRVVRPGSQVSTIVSPAQVPSSLQFGQPGPSVPPSALVRDVLWLNGVSFGAVFRY